MQTAMRPRASGLVASNSSATLRMRLPVRRVIGVRAQAAATSVVETYTNGSSTAATEAAPAPTVVYAAPPAPTPQVLSPAEAYMYVAKDGAKKAAMDPTKTFITGLYAGAYIAFGGLLSTLVVNACPGLATSNPGLAKLLFALVFPVGLFINTMHGMELFTGNTMKLPAAVIEGKATIGGLIKNWFWSYSGNFVGSLMFVALVAATGLLAGATLPVKTALYKTSLTWSQAFLRAMMANWLVCVAVWNAGAAQSLPGKILGIWPCIAAFVAMGLEHSVANMFLIPLGIACGADITFGHFITSNLIPVTLGNIVGGMVFMGFGSAYAFGSWGKNKAAATA